MHVADTLTADFRYSVTLSIKAVASGLEFSL